MEVNSGGDSKAVSPDGESDVTFSSLLQEEADALAHVGGKDKQGVGRPEPDAKKDGDKDAATDEEITARSLGKVMTSIAKQSQDVIETDEILKRVMKKADLVKASAKIAKGIKEKELQLRNFHEKLQKELRDVLTELMKFAENDDTEILSRGAVEFKEWRLANRKYKKDEEEIEKLREKRRAISIKVQNIQADMGDLFHKAELGADDLIQETNDASDQLGSLRTVASVMQGARYQLDKS